MIPPEAIHTLQIRYRTNSDMVWVTGPEELRILCMVMENMLPTYYHSVTKEILRRGAACHNDFQFRYPNEAVMDIGEQPWEGVELSIWNNECAYISEAAFEAVMLRMFHFFIDEAKAHNHRWVGTPEWHTFLHNVAALEARVGARG